MVTRLHRRLSARDLDDLPHEWDTLYELIEGVLYLSRRPSRRHQRIIATIVMEIGPVVRAAGGDVLPEPGVVWEEDGDDNVSPDVAVVLAAQPQGAKEWRTLSSPRMAAHDAVHGSAILTRSSFATTPS